VEPDETESAMKTYSDAAAETDALTATARLRILGVQRNVLLFVRSPGCALK